MILIKNLINNLSIKHKLVTLSIVTSTIATLITFVVFTIFYITSERVDLINEVKLVTKIFSEELSDYVMDKEEEQIEKSLNAVRNRAPFIQTCVFLDKHKEKFVEFINDKKRSKPCKELAEVKSKTEFRKDKVTGEYLVSSFPIIRNSHKIGYVTMVVNTDRIGERVHRIMVALLAIFLIVLSISYIFSRFLQKTISNPILHLAQVSSVVREGNYKIRAIHYSNDELGILTEAYNNMLDEIQDAKENLEKKVIERTKDLENLTNIKVQFLSNMSHEIRTPIHGIMNYIDFLFHDWENLSENKKYDFVKKLYNNSNKLLSLINNLLDLSKFNEGKMYFSMQKHNMVILLEDVINESEALYMQNKELSIEFIYNKELNYNGFFDQERITQVVRNLVSNAIKFTPKGKIIVQLSLTKIKKENQNKVPAIEVSISDEGVGVPDNELESIFDKFNQSAKTKTNSGGTGLGLTISKEIILAHKGEIWAKNNDNIGSTFTFIIPINQHKSKDSTSAKVNAN